MTYICFPRFINTDTLQTLQILENESHPNSHNQGPTKTSSGSKEGLSVYGLFQHLARTPQGRYLLRQIFLRPSLDLATINERHCTIQTFLRPENVTALDSLVDSLKSIGNMRMTMINLRKGVGRTTGKYGGLSSSVWASIRRVSSIVKDEALVGIDMETSVCLSRPENQGLLPGSGWRRTSSRWEEGASLYFGIFAG